MGFKCVVVFVAVIVCTSGQHSRNANTTPVPILRQINTHNDDGSYTYGYESGDGSYKIETKSPNGELKGKYGYYDDEGQLREIEYGADKNGFVSSGTGIPPQQSAPVNSAPVQPPRQRQQQFNNYQQPAISNAIPNTHSTNSDDNGDYDPSKYETPYAYRPEIENDGNYNYQDQQQQYSAPQPNQQFQYQQQPQSQQPFQYQQPQPQQSQPQPSYYNAVQNPNLFLGHPASNFNLNTGTYSINY